jgi:hypothetical protein
MVCYNFFFSRDSSFSLTTRASFRSQVRATHSYSWKLELDCVAEYEDFVAESAVAVRENWLPPGPRPIVVAVVDEEAAAPPAVPLREKDTLEPDGVRAL